jgi:hypothetical protein
MAAAGNLGEAHFVRRDRRTPVASRAELQLISSNSVYGPSLDSLANGFFSFHDQF